MGYATRIYVLAKYSFQENPCIGQEIASLELGKCHEGFVFDIFKKGREFSEEYFKENRKPYFAVWPRNPDRQQEAVELLRTIEDPNVNKLSNDIEDGLITTDCYDNCLGVNGINEVIDAFEKDISQENTPIYSVALATLKAIKEHYSYQLDDLVVISFGH